jgi:hypothetical protein
MTLEELAKISGVKNETIKKNIKTVPRIYQDDDGIWVIPDGSRYPYDAHRCFLQALFGQSCKIFLGIVASPNWTKLQRHGCPVLGRPNLAIADNI